MRVRPLECVLIDGAVEIRDVSVGDAELVWASDDDPDFLEAMEGVEFIEPDDLEDVVNYLVDTGVISDAEADEMQDFAEETECDDDDVEVDDVDAGEGE
jgi:hypothetical protein